MRMAPRHAITETSEYGSHRVAPTLSGYTLWAIEQLARRKRESLAEAASYAIERWVDENADYLSRFDISLDRFDADLDNRVVPITPNPK
jgi:hypothetical protein